VISRLLWLVSILVLVAVVWSTSLFLDDTSIDDFLEQHWAYPVPPQGEPPQEFSTLEASLDPASCGKCHTEQYAQWRNSLHSHTMSAGIRWQLQLADMETAKSCMRCHAPLTEQLALLSQKRGWSKAATAPPDYIPSNLDQLGLVCAACHVRSHRRYGPAANNSSPDITIHGGFIEHKAFEDSRFCAHCHQFPESGSRINGKLHEDTYNQWKASRFSTEGTQCQSCHMPQRQHLWKGIHDEAMTRSALTVNLGIEQVTDGENIVYADVINSGAGHHFPTYLVPEVLLSLEYVDALGEVTQLARHVLAWRANLALTKEVFDQRLASGESLRVNSNPVSLGLEGRIRLRVSVAPRQHYVRTFETYLKANAKNLDDETRGLLEQAISEAKAAEYDFIAADQPMQRVAN